MLHVHVKPLVYNVHTCYIYMLINIHLHRYHIFIQLMLIYVCIELYIYIYIFFFKRSPQRGRITKVLSVVVLSHFGPKKTQILALFVLIFVQRNHAKSEVLRQCQDKIPGHGRARNIVKPPNGVGGRGGTPLRAPANGSSPVSLPEAFGGNRRL